MSLHRPAPHQHKQAERPRVAAGLRECPSCGKRYPVIDGRPERCPACGARREEPGSSGDPGGPRAS